MFLYSFHSRVFTETGHWERLPYRSPLSENSYDAEECSRLSITVAAEWECDNMATYNLPPELEDFQRGAKLGKKRQKVLEERIFKKQTQRKLKVQVHPAPPQLNSHFQL